MDASKACQDTDVPTKILKEMQCFCRFFTHKLYWICEKKSEFLSALKQGNKTPVFKKGEREFKKYRPVSILSNISKIFERIIFR